MTLTAVGVRVDHRVDRRPGEARQSRGRSKEQQFTFDNSALVFIDYQPEMLGWVKSTDTKRMMVNARALARLAVRMGMPVI